MDGTTVTAVFRFVGNGRCDVRRTRMNPGNQLVSALGNGPYESRAFGVVAECLSQLTDTVVESVLPAVRPSPQVADDLIAPYNFTLPLCQKQQHVHRLGRDVDFAARPSNLTGARVDISVTQQKSTLQDVIHVNRDLLSQVYRV